jgi:hypothetical protein
MRKLALTVFIFLSCILSLTAQELNCNVQVNSDQVQTTNRQIFTSLQKSISEFVNNRRWTDMQILPSERINCNMVIIIKKMDVSSFEAEIQLQSTRPVYKSSYNTTLFNFRDQTFNFQYTEYTPLEFSENTFDTNLTAVIAYYVYIIIGYDADSFSRLGGTPYFRKAENICALAQSTSESGWKAFDSGSKQSDRNRYALINAITNDNYKKFREFFYEYHRWGLDEMVTNVDKSRDKIANSLPTLRDLNKMYPSNLIITTFLDAKTDELVNIFSKGSEKEKTTVYNLLMDLNPTQSNKYEPLKKN